jgi:hypothetical protein
MESIKLPIRGEAKSPTQMVILSEAKNPTLWVVLNEVKDLINELIRWATRAEKHFYP